MTEVISMIVLVLSLELRELEPQNLVFPVLWLFKAVFQSLEVSVAYVMDDHLVCVADID